MKVLSYLQLTLEVKASELIDFKKELPEKDWVALKDDARKEAASRGIWLED